jgi:hypothetical protein
MILECHASNLNLRTGPDGKIIGELRKGDRFSPSTPTNKPWVEGTVKSGLFAGAKGYVRRKWLSQVFDTKPRLASKDRSQAALIVDRRTTEFDHVAYGLGDKAKSFNELTKLKTIDCSGWVYLTAGEILRQEGAAFKISKLYDSSDAQVVSVGEETDMLISGSWLEESHFQAGCLVGIDFAEYSWDRNRPLDIDHVVIVGGMGAKRFISQSSSSGGGVNRVALAKWLESTKKLRSEGRVFVVDLLALA